MVLRMKNVNILGVHWKNWTFKGGGVTKNQYRSGVRLNKGGGLRQFANIRGDLERKGAVFLRGGVGELIPRCTLCILNPSSLQDDTLVALLLQINWMLLQDVKLTTFCCCKSLIKKTIAVGFSYQLSILRNFFTNCSNCKIDITMT